MKRHIVRALTALVLLSVLVGSVAAAGLAGMRTSSPVSVDGQTVSFDAYNIQGNNYFKLRDVAAALNGTLKQFEVTWDGAKKAVNLLPIESYTSVGGELIAGAGSPVKQALASSAKIYCDGVEVSLKAYNIEGNNYVKLRDLAALLDFGVGYEASTKAVQILSTSGYIENASVELEVLALVNAERAKLGLSALTWSDEMATVAREHSRDMANNDFFDHVNLRGESPVDRMLRHDLVDYRRVSENIAAGQKTPEEVMQAWMDSPGHKANILEPSVTELGVGYVYQENTTYGHYWTQNFRAP